MGKRATEVKQTVQVAWVFFSWLQSLGSPVGRSSMVGHVSDLSLSGHSHAFTFSSTEVSLSFPFSPFFLLFPPMEHSLSNHFVLPEPPLSF